MPNQKLARVLVQHGLAVANYLKSEAQPFKLSEKVLGMVNILAGMRGQSPRTKRQRTNEHPTATDVFEL